MNCLDRIQTLMAAEGLTDSACIPIASCRIVKQYLLEKAGLLSTHGTAVFSVIPYRTPTSESTSRNISAYAVSRDYHLFFRQTAEKILSPLRSEYPHNIFAAFADHSPFAEVDAAARAGLGVVGSNGLLLTEKYSSFVFICCIVTDAEPTVEPTIPKEPPHCDNCGACRLACPIGKNDTCLSAVTQQKKEPSDTEWDIILNNGILWGCDICQDACPYTKKAKDAGTIYTKIPFFYENELPHLTVDFVSHTSDDILSERAWSWRGKDVILRNLKKSENIVQRKGNEKC